MPMEGVVVDAAYIESIVNFDLRELKKDRGKLLDAISVRVWLSPVSIKNIFELSDEEMQSPDIQKAMQYGKDKIADIFGAKRMVMGLRDDNPKAIEYFMQICGAKQPERQYQFNYNQKGEEDWESLKKNSDFN